MTQRESEYLQTLNWCDVAEVCGFQLRKAKRLRKQVFAAMKRELEPEFASMTDDDLARELAA